MSAASASGKAEIMTSTNKQTDKQDQTPGKWQSINIAKYKADKKAK